MCGIAGIISVSKKGDHESQLKVMNKILHHRGPDGLGFWIDEKHHVFFSHNRLSIIDLTSHAAQPMMSYDDRFVITFNGEIYNYKELREECIKLGSKFTSHSDTEVIIESYRHWGTEAFKRFRGMWAFALYDKKKNEIILSRDPFGIKPLYYGYYNQALYFASEPKALRGASNYFSEIDEASVALFNEFGYLDRGDWTFYKNIKRFPHANYAIINLNKTDIKLTPEVYWSLPTASGRVIKYDEAVEKLRDLLINSVKLHLRSDVQVGACLSGGLDSSGIVCIGNKICNQNFKTFTVHYSSYSDINEKMWADKVIDHTNASPIYVEPTYESFLNDFDSVLHTQDEPFGSTSIFAQYEIFKAIGASGIKVVLDGQGSDEQLSGYLGLVPQFLTSLLKSKQYFTYCKESRLLGKNYSLKNSLLKLFRSIAIEMLYGRKSTSSSAMNTNKGELIDSFEERLKFLSFIPGTHEQTLNQLLCDSNIPQLLRYEDRNSMAFSVESRVPFLETELVEFIMSLPADYKVRNGYTKAVLRDALKGLVPDDVRLRLNKLGFPTPEIEWLRQGFNLDLKTTGSKAWRELATKRWRNLIAGA